MGTAGPDKLSLGGTLTDCKYGEVPQSGDLPETPEGPLPGGGRGDCMAGERGITCLGHDAQPQGVEGDSCLESFIDPGYTKQAGPKWLKICFFGLCSAHRLYS